MTERHLVMKVLIVDDEKNNRLLLEELLETLFEEALEKPLSMEIRFCDNGLDAYNFVLNDHFELVLLDYHLPEMTGIEVISALYKNLQKPSPTIVMVTGSAYHDKDEFNHPLIKGWLRKPLSLERVKKVVGAMMEASV